MTYRLLLWRGRAGCDRKVLQQSYKDEGVLLRVKIIQGKKKTQMFLLPHGVCDLGFSLASPSHSWINFQIDRAKSTLGPGTKFRASEVIQDNAVKNGSPEGLYLHHEPRGKFVSAWKSHGTKPCSGAEKTRRLPNVELLSFISEVQISLTWPPSSRSSPRALEPSTSTRQRLSSDSLQRRLSEAEPRLTLCPVAAVQSWPAQATPVPLGAGGRKGVQCRTAESGGEQGAAGDGEDRRTASPLQGKAGPLPQARLCVLMVPAFPSERHVLSAAAWR